MTGNCVSHLFLNSRSWIIFTTVCKHLMKTTRSPSSPSSSSPFKNYLCIKAKAIGVGTGGGGGGGHARMKGALHDYLELALGNSRFKKHFSDCEDISDPSPAPVFALGLVSPHHWAPCMQPMKVIVLEQISDPHFLDMLTSQALLMPNGKKNKEKGKKKRLRL